MTDFPLSKYKLQQMGFDFIDQDRNFEKVFEQVKPGGESQFRLAYAYGIGQMLEFNREYINNSTISQGDFVKPEYLHLVIGQEPDSKSEIPTMKELFNLQQNMIQQLQKEYFEKTFNEGMEMSQLNKISHKTVFVPYWSDEKMVNDGCLLGA